MTEKMDSKIAPGRGIGWTKQWEFEKYISLVAKAPDGSIYKIIVKKNRFKKVLTAPDWLCNIFKKDDSDSGQDNHS